MYTENHDISTAQDGDPTIGVNEENSFITRLNISANTSNSAKTLQYLRNDLNRFLEDIDQEFGITPDDERPEYEQGGRQKEMNKPFKDRGARGRDPLGKQTKNRRPLALAHFDALKKTMGKKSKTILKETNQVDEMNKEYDEYKEEKGKD